MYPMGFDLLPKGKRISTLEYAVINWYRLKLNLEKFFVFISKERKKFENLRSRL